MLNWLGVDTKVRVKRVFSMVETGIIWKLAIRMMILNNRTALGGKFTL